MAPTISVVLPVYNECENLDALVTRLVPVLQGFPARHAGLIRTLNLNQTLIVMSSWCWN